MKLGLFIPALIGFLFVNLTLAFTLNGGISRKTNPLTGINSFSIDGTLGANDIVKAIILSGAVALMTGLAPVSGVWGLIAFIVALAIGAFYVKWSWDDAATVVETLLFMALIFGVHLLAISGLSSSGTLFGFGVERVLKTIECLVLIVAETIVVVNVLMHHYNNESKKKNEVFKYSAIAVIVVAVILFIVTIAGG